MKYKVEITEILQKIIEVEASNEKEAYNIIKEKYLKEEIILDDTNYIETKIDII
jgi:hypothetical protein